MLKKCPLGAGVLAAALLLPAQAAVAASYEPGKPVRPAKVAAKLYRAWLAGDRAAARALTTREGVRTLFAYPFRAPGGGPVCAGRVCDFRHTGVPVPGGLNGIRMIVSAGKVARVYTSRHLVQPAAAAKRLDRAYRAGDRDAALEVASVRAVRQRFKVPYDPDGVPREFVGCVKEPKGFICHWYYEGGSEGVHVRGTKARGYYVAFITWTAD